MQTIDIKSEKKNIRQAILAARGQLTEITRSASDAAITARLLQRPEYQHADTVMGYMNFGSEFASEAWVTRSISDGKRVVLPRVDHHTNQLDLYIVDDLENQLEAGFWGIREPIVERCERLYDINEVEFALLPGVAFCRDGARLGYGGGFYDKLLAHLHAPYRITLATAAYALQIVAQLPQEATDIKVGWIVTEAETIDCSATGSS